MDITKENGSIKEDTVFGNKFTTGADSEQDSDVKAGSIDDATYGDPQDINGNLSTGFVNPCALELDFHSGEEKLTNTLKAESDIETMRQVENPLKNDANGYVNPCAFEADFQEMEPAEPKAKEKGLTAVRSKMFVSKSLEIGILTAGILLVWALFSLPTVFYILTPQKSIGEQTNITGTPTTTNNSSDICLQHTSYTGSVCRNELAMWEECFSGPLTGRQINIPTTQDQTEVENTAHNLLELGLPFLQPSLECELAIRPFICLYLFGSCDATEKLHHALQKECMMLRDEVCAQEWKQAENYLGQNVLPDCELLPDQTDKCIAIDSSGLPSAQDALSTINEGSAQSENPLDPQCTMEVCVNTTVSNTTEQLDSNCSAGFYWSNRICRPECVEWINPNYLRTETIEKGVIIAISLLALLSCIALIVIALTVQRESLLRFPSIYHFYIVVSNPPLALIALISFTDKKALFCSSRDLLETFEDETPFCTLSGMVYLYTLLQNSMWLTFHAVTLCWGIVLPFHYRRFKCEGKLKRVHITTVVLAIFLPLVPVFVLLKDGYTIVYSRPILCTGRNRQHTFFTVVLPICILLATCSSALILLFWTILKEFFFKKISKQKRQFGIIGKAEVKIMVTVCYYILLGVLGLVVYTYWDATNKTNAQAYQDYFLCEGAGKQPEDNECDILLNDPTVHLPNQLYIAAIALLGLLPVVVLLFSVSIKDWKKTKHSRKRSLPSNKFRSTKRN